MSPFRLSKNQNLQDYIWKKQEVGEISSSGNRIVKTAEAKTRTKEKLLKL